MFKRKKKEEKEEIMNAIETQKADLQKNEEKLDSTIKQSKIYSFKDFEPDKYEAPKLKEEPTVLMEEVNTINIIEEPIKEPSKKDITSFFDTDKNKSDQLKTTEPKSKKVKKEKKSTQRKQQAIQDIKDRKVFKYKKKKYSKVEDFIKFVNDHYLDIDTIAKEVLDNEHFYGWIHKKSGKFEESLKEFEIIKEKIQK